MVSQPNASNNQDASNNQENDKKEPGLVKFLEIPSIKLIVIPISKSLVVPIILAGVAGWITLFNNDHQQNRADQSNQLQQNRAEASNALQQKLANNKQRDAVLTQYIQNMKELLLDKDHPLRESKENDVRRDIARALTKTTLQQLTSGEEDKKGQNTHKASVLSFLSLSNLIKTNPCPPDKKKPQQCDKSWLKENELKYEKFRLTSPIVMLGSSTLGDDMDFSGADFPEGYLEEAALSSVNLSNANLTGAYLNMANLAATRLDNANLKNAQLNGAYLLQTYLFNAKNLTNEQIKSACNWKGAIYTEADENLKPRLEPKDQQANKRKIQEIEDDKASDPSKTVDCSQWKNWGLATD